MVTQALIAAFIYYLCELGGRLFSGMMTRPLIVGTLVGLALGDLSTGCIVGAQMETLYLGVVAVGGATSTNVGLSTTIGVALCVMFGYTFEESIVISIPLGYIGLVLEEVNKVIQASFVPIFDKLIAEDKGDLFCRLFILGPFISKLALAVPVFFALTLGAPAMQEFIDNLPPFIYGGMKAASKMLPAVGMGVLLNYLWNPELVLYFIIGFTVSAYLGVPNLFMAILGVFLAYVSFRNSKEIQDSLKDRGVVGNATGDVKEDFFDE